MTDFRFPHPSRFFLSGPSGSGKTNWCLNVLRLSDIVFAEPRCKQNVVYFYNELDPKFEDAKNEGLIHHWINMKPTVEMVKQYTEHCIQYGGSVVIIDDFGDEINKQFNRIFKYISSKFNATVFMLTQNLFEKDARGMTLNATHIVVFKNAGDISQITTLARRKEGKTYQWLVDAYVDATERPYSYLMIDLHPMTNNLYRVRANVLPHEGDMKIYYEKSKFCLNAWPNVRPFAA
jgi:hypothetical protein